MIDTLRQYWIGLLVLVMIGLHAGIVALIRIEAQQAKESLSCEVDLGSFYIGRSGDKGAVHLRLHALVPINHRLQSRQLFDLNHHQIRQAAEEYCRQADPTLLSDPLLTELKDNLIDALVRTVGETALEDVVVTDLRPEHDQESLAFSNDGHGIKATEKVVITRKARDQERRAEHEAAKEAEHDAHGGGHGESHGDDRGGGHGEAHGDSHGASHGGGH